METIKPTMLVASKFFPQHEQTQCTEVKHTHPRPNLPTHRAKFTAEECRVPVSTEISGTFPIILKWQTQTLTS